MEEFIIKKIEYNETFLRIIVSDINRIFAYWNISKEYDNSFVKKFGVDFFEKTKAYLILKNLVNGEKQTIELKEFTNNYYIKFNYANTLYQVNLVRLGNDNRDYGYEIVSNIIKTPSVKIHISNFNDNNIIFRNIKNLKDYQKHQYFSNKEKLEQLYIDEIINPWNEYKKENGYREK